MKFGPVPLDEARGAILAHSAELRGGRLRKGKVLDEADLARMTAEGWSDVIVARLEAGDVAEDAAATRIARAVVAGASGLRLTKAATGRVNIHATGPGVLRIERAAVDRINHADPMVTLATLPPWQRVAEGEMVATVKIIAYAVPEEAVATAEAAGAGGLDLLAPKLTTATLIVTALGRAEAGPEGLAGDKGVRSIADRLARLGAKLTETAVVAHRTEAIAAAIARATGEIVMILTASATSDPEDVAPAAVRAAGGTVAHFGMPVDPGNLLFLGRLGERPVIGLPGCARSPALNGADWILERTLCGVPVHPEDIMSMGVGGLLKEIPTRPRPRSGPVASGT
jgi:molybdenum cofactor cytidylyltransferase